MNTNITVPQPQHNPKHVPRCFKALDQEWEKTSHWVIWNLKVEGGNSEHLLHLAHYDIDTDNSESCADVGKSVRSKKEACWLLAVLYNMAAAH